MCEREINAGMWHVGEVMGEGRKDGIMFYDNLNTFILRLYMVGYRRKKQ